MAGSDQAQEFQDSHDVNSFLALVVFNRLQQLISDGVTQMDRASLAIALHELVNAYHSSQADVFALVGHQTHKLQSFVL